MDKKIIVCCGCGGVGKTTISAAIALAAAILGKRAIVLTIDPARRLATALGLDSFKQEIARVDISELEKAGIKPRGELFAAMLDTKRTFDKVIEKYAPSQKIYQKIVKNPIYEHMAGAVSGSQEYMALERMYELYNSKDYDLFVLDTPPAKSALDFLDAPRRLMEFMDESVLSWFIKIPKILGRLPLSFAMNWLDTPFSIVERITGYHVVKDFSELLIDLAGMYDGFKSRAKAVKDSLRSDETGFFLISDPRTSNSPENLYFCERLLEENMPLGCIIINKVHVDPLEDTAFRADVPAMIEKMRKLLISRDISESNASRILKRLVGNLNRYETLASRDRKEIERFMKHVPKDIVIYEIPFMEEDIHDLPVLSKLSFELIDLFLGQKMKKQEKAR